MPITGDLEAIRESDLLELRENQVSEGILIDYKRTTYGGSDDEKREALKDVSSFANTAGGHMVLGMDEAAGLPTNLLGLDGDLDAEIRRLDNLFRDCIEPRVAGMRMRSVPLASGRCALVVRIPKSWNPPHAVSFRGSRRYYARNSAGVHETSVEELRAMFTASATLYEKIRGFHRERAEEVHSGRTPVTLGDPGRMLLHVVPFSAFGGNAGLDPRSVAGLPLSPIWHHDYTARYNFIGYFTASGAADRGGYVQVYRNGTIESAAGGICVVERRGQVLYAEDVEDQVVTKVADYMNALSVAGLSPPIVVLLAGIRMHEAGVARNSTPEPRPAGPVGTGFMFFPPVTFEDFGNLESYREGLRPMFDALWNAAGYEASLSYGADGHWRRRT